MCGAHWLVKSRDVLIQYMSSDRYSTIQGLAIGGPFLQGHNLVIDSKMWLTWDGESVADWDTGFDNLVTLRVFQERIYQNHRRPMSLEVDLPDRVSLTVNFGAIGNGVFEHFIDVFIMMPKPEGGVDGYCGDADGDLSDETKQHVWRRTRAGELRVPQGQYLFDRELSHNALLLEEPSDTDIRPNSVEDEEDEDDEEEVECLAGSYEEVFSQCSVQLPNSTAWGFVAACALDVCVGGEELINHTAALAEQSVEVVENEEMLANNPSVDEPVVVCHTCVPGDYCFMDVKWAMEIGIPQKVYEGMGWTPAVNESSCFEEVQEALRLWQFIDNFTTGGMLDMAFPAPCGSEVCPCNSSGMQETRNLTALANLTYCR